jgi:ATP-dependent RNA helicase DDX46/PRP5
MTEEELKKKLEDEKQQERRAKLAAWKAKKEAEKLAAAQDRQPDNPAKVAEPKMVAQVKSNEPPNSPVTEEHLTKHPGAIEQSQGPIVTEKLQRKAAKSTFKLDDKAPVKVPGTAAVKAQPATVLHSGNDTPPDPLKPLGTISSFGLKPKVVVEGSTKRKALFDEEEDTKRRTFEKLPDFVPDDQPMQEGDDDAGLEDEIASDDEDAAAARLAAAEKRRNEATSGDIQMTDAPVVEKAAVDEEIDPLDAYMATLVPELTSHRTHLGQAFYGDETEVDMEAVDTEDLLLANTTKKTKREIPVVDHSKEDYAPFRKNFYVEPAELKELTPEEVADLRLELDGIKTKPEKVPAPVMKWGQMGLSAATLGVLEQLGYSKPTPIQAQAIPVAESGHDMIGVAKTGSGKTLAFGIPIIRHIIDQSPLSARDGPICLILVPTRELALQISRELKPFLKASHLRAVSAYGGAPIKDQIGELKRGHNHVLVATPGRLIDLLMSNSGRVLSFKRITYVVLDEADRMFDMGFEPQVTKIMANIRPDRQTVLFSATFPKNMQALAKKILTKPVEVTVGGRSVVPPEITQIVRVLKPEEKVNELLRHLGELLHEDEDARALVFVERQEKAEDLLQILMRKGYPCNSIHGAKDQIDRSDAINDLKNGAIPLLIATSVAARGLDIPQLKLVVNYDCPTHLEDYVHRCGRTGRAGNTGTAITFIENPGQERFSAHIYKALKQSNAPIPAELEAMHSQFLEDVKAGKQKWNHFNAGFTGKGLDKLDEHRQLEKLREKRAFKTGDEKDDDEEEEEVIAVAKRDSPAPTPTAAPKATPALPELSTEIIVKKTERPTVDARGNLSAKDQAAQAAARLTDRLGKKGTIHPGQPIDNKGPDAGAFHATLEINDWPQKARWAVTNRTNVARILESTGTSITTKGEFYPEGKTPQEGQQPKLYILVEGETELVVKAAMRELINLLQQGATAAQESDIRAPTGRYSVV